MKPTKESAAQREADLERAKILAESMRENVTLRKKPTEDTQQKNTGGQEGMKSRVVDISNFSCLLFFNGAFSFSQDCKD